MFSKKQNQIEPKIENPDRAETLIASGIRIKGKIAGRDKVRIAGYFEGSILCDSIVSVEKNGRVDGRLGARKVVVAGEINGDIRSTGQVDLKSEGRLLGNVKAANFTLTPKSIFTGQATIPRKAVELLILSSKDRPE
jgi:cytoskeletal protein CcmA (bactofilin family)